MLLASVNGLSAVETAAPGIDREILDKWSALYWGWHYWPDHVIASDPKIPGSENFKHTDVPCVYQLTETWSDFIKRCRPFPFGEKRMATKAPALEHRQLAMQYQILQHELLASLAPGKEDTQDCQNQLEHIQASWRLAQKNKSGRAAMKFSLPTAPDRDQCLVFLCFIKHQTTR